MKGVSRTPEPCGTGSLGSREDPVAPPTGGRTLDAVVAVEAVFREVRMADVAYLLVIVGGFVLLALILRGVEQL